MSIQASHETGMLNPSFSTTSAAERENHAKKRKQISKECNYLIANSFWSKESNRKGAYLHIVLVHQNLFGFITQCPYLQPYIKTDVFHLKILLYILTKCAVIYKICDLYRIQKRQ